MSRTVAVIWHALFCIAAGVLYFFFVLPRWPELLGETPHTLGVAMRIVAAALIGLAALPVVFTLRRTQKPELRTPQLALTLRVTSIVLHVLAGVLILGAAISEIWLSLDDAGRWLFGIYGAAAAIALLAIFAFYLAFVAELPPPPPKPLKVKEPKQRRTRRKRAGGDTEETTETADTADEDKDAEGGEADTDGDADTDDEADKDTDAEVTVADDDTESAEEPTGEQSPDDESEDGADNGKLRNRRPSGKPEPARRRRRRLRGGVAVED